MSLKHALLAFLAEEPSHGYELKKRFDEALGPLWTIREAQVYNNLRLLERDGLVAPQTVAQSGAPDRKEHALTPTGREALAAWLASPAAVTRKLKDDFYLKLTVLARVLHDEEGLADLLWKQRTVLLQRLRELEGALQAAETSGDPVAAALLEGAILHVEADLAWLDRCEERLLTGGGAP